jgi:hypothetical protein
MLYLTENTCGPPWPVKGDELAFTPLSIFERGNCRLFGGKRTTHTHRSSSVDDIWDASMLIVTVLFSVEGPHSQVAVSGRGNAGDRGDGPSSNALSYLRCYHWKMETVAAFILLSS